MSDQKSETEIFLAGEFQRQIISLTKSLKEKTRTLDKILSYSDFRNNTSFMHKTTKNDYIRIDENDILNLCCRLDYIAGFCKEVVSE